MTNLYLTPAEKYTAALGGFYYGDLPEPGTVYTQLIKNILDGSTPEKEPKNILARFIYSLYISDLGDPYPRYELAKLLYWKLHGITPTKSGSILTVTIDGKEDYMTINTDLSRLWYKVLFGSKTDVITEFPYIFNTMQNKLSDWELFGNVLVSGTPTPDNPIMPQGTGEMTGNLWNNLGFSAGTISTAGVHSLSNTYGTSLSTVSGGSVDITQVASSGTTAYQNGYFFIEIDISQFSLGDNIVISFDYEITNKLSSTSTTVAYVGQGATGSNVIGNWSENGRAIIKATITSAMTRPYVEIRLCGNSIKVRNVQICLGSTALPYEPYGYKIPISSANTTTPVYLGEVETTRKIKKYEFTGQENDWKVASGRFYNDNAITNYMVGISNYAYCSHFEVIEQQTSASPVHDGDICFRNGNPRVYIYNGNYETVTDFTSWLAQQYAAGTPVTIWYVLANEETAVVNEPLMKIGDYADSMSRTQTGIDIPTVIGQNTLDVLTTVKPSSMSIEYTSAEENQSRSKRISLLKSPLKKGLIK